MALGSPQGTGPEESSALSPFTCVSYSACSPRSRRSFPCVAMAAEQGRPGAPLLPRGPGRWVLGFCSQHPASAPPHSTPSAALGAGRPRPGTALERLLWGSHRAGALPPLQLSAGPHQGCLVPKALLSSSQGQRESPKVPSNPTPCGCRPPTSRKLSSHHYQTALFTAWPLALNASGQGHHSCSKTRTSLSHQFPLDSQDIRWGPPFPSHSPER